MERSELPWASPRRRWRYLVRWKWDTVVPREDGGSNRLRCGFPKTCWVLWRRCILRFSISYSPQFSAPRSNRGSACQRLTIFRLRHWSIFYRMYCLFSISIAKLLDSGIADFLLRCWIHKEAFIYNFVLLRRQQHIWSFWTRYTASNVRQRVGPVGGRSWQPPRSSIHNLGPELMYCWESTGMHKPRRG